MSGRAPVLVASNRGPLSFGVGDDGSLVARRGGGGLVSALEAMSGEITWVCAALSDADRRACRTAGPRFGATSSGVAGVRMLDLDRVTYDLAYNAVANRTLWFVGHLLWSAATSPAFGAMWRREWAAYEAYNAAFAAALADEAAPGAAVLVQDYHLVLVPRLLRDLRPDLRVGHFSHTPWAPQEYFAMLPDDVAAAVLRGLLGADRLGFHCARWAAAFLACCSGLLGARVAADEGSWSVSYEGRRTRVAVHPLGIDGPALRDRAAQPDVAARAAVLREQVGDRLLVVRVDRTELSKNIVRGLDAYRELLRREPQLHGRVMHLAFAYPSRHDLPEYREYTGAVQRIATEIVEEFAAPGWEPLRLEVSDDYARSLAAFRLADVLVVNPVRDGMNLVAKEAPVLSERGLALVLSREAGAVDELGGDALVVNPFDVSETAAAMHQALMMPVAERAARTARMAAAATAHPPRRWLEDQLAALR